MDQRRSLILLYGLAMIIVGNLQATQFHKKQKFSRKNVALQAQAETLHDSQEVWPWLKMYAEVIALIEKKGYRALDCRAFVEESLKAIYKLDPHSSFFSPESYKAIKESTAGEFSGIGVSVTSKIPEDDALVIIDVLEQGPSYKSGLRSGDKIIEIAGEKLRGLSTDEVIDRLKGKVGSTVKVKVVRDNKPFEVRIKREVIQDRTSACYYFQNQQVYYLSLKIFNDMSAQQTSKLLKQANAGKCRGIILDLRRNPGGTIDAAIEMAELFLPKNSLVVFTRDRDYKVVNEYKTTKDPIVEKRVPIFILVDNFTASAAEILAGTLRYHAEQPMSNLQVFLLGTTTFGKGSVQELIPLKNDCAIKLTTMLYYLPGDISIQAQGIKPDFMVQTRILPEDDLKMIEEFYGKETALKNFITQEEVNAHKKQTASDTAKSEKEFSWWQRWFKKKRVFVAQQKKSALAQAERSRNMKQQVLSWDQKQVHALCHDVQVQMAVNFINNLWLASKLPVNPCATRKQSLAFLKEHWVTDDEVMVEKVQ